uniref:Ion_trans_2 domain-containing protein n=1 Tax=Bursaphelenchus xylophilus TaxID=6326 RepID=A0A1I7SA79_BURXY
MDKLCLVKNKIVEYVKTLYSSSAIVLSAISLLYLTLGSFIFLFLDDRLNGLQFHRTFFFCFTTLTTIGYGDIVPSNGPSQIYCTIFILFGTPLLFSCFSRWSLLIIKAYNNIVRVETNDDQLPFFVVISSLLIYSLLSGIIFANWLPSSSIVTVFYLGFMSVTTVGFGDFSLHADSMIGALTLVCIQSIGICLMSTLISNICLNLKRINYIGREMWSTNLEEPSFWINGAQFTVTELLTGVSRHFDESPHKLKNLLFELESIIDLDHPDPQNNLEKDGKEITYASVFSSLQEHQNLVHALATVTNLTRSGQKSFRKGERSVRHALQSNAQLDV